MSLDLRRLDRKVRRAVQKLEREAKAMLPKAKDALDDWADRANKMLESCVDAEYGPAAELNETEAAKEEAQDQQEAKRSALLNLHAAVNVQWIEYLTGMMSSVLLGALAEMIQALCDHDAEKFTQAEQLLRTTIGKSIEKRSALDRELADLLGPQALAFEDDDPIDYPYEPLYAFMKRLAKEECGQKTADWMKNNQSELKRLIEAIDPVWKDALLKKHPAFDRLVNRG